MKNIIAQGFWTFYDGLLIFNFLNARKQIMAASERHWIVEETAELNQLIYFRDVLTSKWKLGNVLH